jgi:DNA repair protein RadC
MLVIAGRQLAKQQEDDFFKGEQKFSVDQARSIGNRLGVDWSKVDIEQFRTGLGVEMEHADVTGGDPLTTGRIVLAHLKEKPDYYARLTRAGLEASEKSCPTGTCHPFSQLVKDPEKFAVCMARAKKIGELGTPESFYRLVREDLETQSQETFVVVCVDFRGQLMDYVLINRGQRHKVSVDIEDVLAPVLASRCDGFVCCHNHPTGIAEPSDADAELTESIKKGAAAACPATSMLDHLVIGSKQWYSFANNGWKVDGKVQKS